MNNHLTQPVCLYAIVSELLTSYCRVHPERSSYLLNAVPRDVFTYQRRNWIVHLLGDLYNLLTPLPKEQPVKITARVIHGEVKLFLAEEHIKSKPGLTRLFSFFTKSEGGAGSSLYKNY